MNFRTLILAAFLFGAGTALAYDERSLIVEALRSNPDIVMLEVNRSLDSLTLQSIEAGWLPKVSIDISASKHLLDSIHLPPAVIAQIDTASDGTITVRQIPIDPSTNHPRSEIRAGAGVLQALPGGGSATVNVSQGLVTSAKPAEFSSGFEAALEQPLLRNAWLHGQLDYRVRLALLNNTQLSLRRQKSLLREISAVRNLYWTLYLQLSRFTVAENSRARAEQLLVAERSSLRVGEASPLDTLSAALELLKAQQQVLDSRIAVDRARNALADALMAHGDSVSVADSGQISISDLPAEETIEQLVEQYDPDLRIFENAAQQLRLQLDQERTTLLPELNVKGSISHARSSDEILTDRQSTTNAVISVILRYSLPIKEAKIAVAKASLDTLRNSIEYRKYRGTLRTRLRELRQSWQQEKMRVSIAEASRDIAERQLTATTRGYELGTIDRLTFLKARDDYTAAQITLIEARVGMKRLEILFDEITGTAFERFGIRTR